jgi:tetratricopeptide (TPR) repeat protein
MRKPIWIIPLAVLVILTASALIFYQLPPVNERLSWRVESARTYMRKVFNPIEAMPTALPRPDVALVTREVATALPTATPKVLLPSALPPTPTPTDPPPPETVTLPSPAWEKQDMNNCGPAALAMYLRTFGWEGDQKTITEVIKPYRDDRNVNVEELAYYVRTQAGWLQIQYRVGGDLELLKRLLAAGLPVMIEESFFFEEDYWPEDDHWAAHYQLLTGYDEKEGVFIGQDSFHGPDQRIDYEKLDEYWQSFNRVYIMIYPPDKEATIKKILGDNWDPDLNRQNALEVSQAETQAQPKNAYAWFNLGSNLVYFDRNGVAASAYDTARQLGLYQRMLRYQFGPFFAYFHAGMTSELLTVTEYALERTPNSEEALLWHGWALYRMGKKLEAAADWQKALENHPGYQDAQYALDFLAANP